jgi:hypothetical protein
LLDFGLGGLSAALALSVDRKPHAHPKRRSDAHDGFNAEANRKTASRRSLRKSDGLRLLLPFGLNYRRFTLANRSPATDATSKAKGENYRAD